MTFGVGYAQGFGDIGAILPSLTDQSSAGGELQLGVHASGGITALELRGGASQKGVTRLVTAVTLEHG
jgi:hypothetical protein